MLHPIFAGRLTVMFLERLVEIGPVRKAKLARNRGYSFVGVGKHIGCTLYCEIERIPGNVHSCIGLHDSVQIAAGIAQFLNKQFTRDAPIGFFQ